MTVAQRLAGCPDGATYDTLRKFHSDQELARAVASGQASISVRSYAKPRNFKVIWFHATEQHQ
jgi:hypothetical protein